MSALQTKRIRDAYKFRFLELVLKQGEIAFHQARLCFNGAGKVVVADGTPGLQSIGMTICDPAESVDATAGDTVFTCDLLVERDGEWWANDSAPHAVATSDVGNYCYIADDQTVTMTPTGSVAGRIWAVDANRGVLVESNTAGVRRLLDQPTLPAYVTNTSTPTDIVQDAVYAVPATAAASVVTLPAAAKDGTRAYFVGDGTANGHTITFKDETGTVTLNTATTAAKRFLATAVKTGGKWAVAVTVAP